jgi:antitoxin (DNA-binding transcriptional repressor) of toxin-antitoxin stability system
MAQAKADLSQLASRASAGDRIQLLRRGKAVAALVSPADLEILETTARTTSFLHALDQFRKRHAKDLPARSLNVRRSAGRRVK